jgi:hypothetical protein
MGFPDARAKDLIVLNPIRMPVNDPGPAATAKASTSWIVRPRSSRIKSTAGNSLSEWVSEDTQFTSANNFEFSKSATEPWGVVVSTAKISIFLCHLSRFFPIAEQPAYMKDGMLDLAHGQDAK